MLPKTITKIGTYAFRECAIPAVAIPEGITELEEGLFFRCGKLASVSIPGSVTKIGNNVFSCCTSLASIRIPSGVTEIGDAVFMGCTALAEIRYDGSLEQWAAIQKGEVWNRDVPAKEVLVRKQG